MLSFDLLKLYVHVINDILSIQTCCIIEHGLRNTPYDNEHVVRQKESLVN